MGGFISYADGGSSSSREPQEVRAQFLEAVLIECTLGICEDEPREGRFEAPRPIVKCDPFRVAAAIPIEPSLDFQLAPVVDHYMGGNLRRRSDDPMLDVGTEIPLQLLDAFGSPPIRRDDDVDRLELSKKLFQPRQMAEEPAAERVVPADRMKHTINIQEQQIAGIARVAKGIMGQRRFCRG
jgi:hypothetical protein